MAETDTPTTRHEYNPFGTDRSEIVDELPDDPDVIEASEVTVVFVAQAWINERAVETDDPRHTFTLPLAELWEPSRDTSNGRHDDPWRIDGSAGNHWVPDQFKTHEKNLDRYQDWSGPFEIKVVAVEIPEEADRQENASSPDLNTDRFDIDSAASNR